MNCPPRPTWVEVSRAALRNNLQRLRSCLRPQVELMAVVKANAYGHGAPETARTLQEAGADRFAVATLGEARELRRAGIVRPILVLGYTPPWQTADALPRRDQPDRLGPGDRSRHEPGRWRPGRLPHPAREGQHRDEPAGAAPGRCAAVSRPSARAAQSRRSKASSPTSPPPTSWTGAMPTPNLCYSSAFSRI